MRINELVNLTENRSHSCIVVDVQPEYCKRVSNICLKIIDFVNKQTGPILMFVNAEHQGLTYDKISTIKEYWEDNGFNPNNWNRVEIVDKGYGYFRSWMDSGIEPNVIIKIIREMYRQRVTDSRDLFQKGYDDSYEDLMTQLIGGEPTHTQLYDPIIVEWTSIAQLKRFSGSYIFGGGRNECLREVELLMNAFNVKYKRIDSLVYG
jgi:hypothetical protein